MRFRDVASTQPGLRHVFVDPTRANERNSVRPERVDHQLLRRARLDRGISKVEAAEFLAVSPSSYARWERGRAQPQPQHLMRIAQFCRCELNELKSRPSMELQLQRMVS